MTTATTASKRSTGQWHHKIKQESDNDITQRELMIRVLKCSNHVTGFEIMAKDSFTLGGNRECVIYIISGKVIPLEARCGPEGG